MNSVNRAEHGVAADAVSQQQADKIVTAVAAWLGHHGWGPEPGVSAPIGPAAASRALGPELVMDWDWPGRPTPTVLLEGGPADWAVEVSFDTNITQLATQIGVSLEPYAGYALCIYPA